MTDVRPGYTLLEGPPSVVDYLALRRDTGMHPKTREQAEAGIAGAWAAVHVRHVQSGATVGMGRVIGDGGWYFHIADMATHPDHQRRGHGRAVLERLLERITAVAPGRPYVTLMGDAPGRPLYSSMGFTDAMPASLGMVWEPGGGDRAAAAS